MSSLTAGLPSPPGRRARDFGAIGGVVAGAALAGALLFHGPLLVAIGFCLLPLVVWLLGRPGPALLLLGASIPITYSLTGGRGGFNLSPSDLLLLFVGAAIVFEAVVTDSLPSVAALGPVRKAVGQYGVFMMLLLTIHLSVSDFAKTGQRFELFLLPLIVGAFAALTGRHVGLLKAYVLATTILAAAWPVAHSLGQKNPVGQMIANAILVLVGVRALRRYLPCALILVPGLFLTASRGAILAVAIGLAVIAVLQDSRIRTLSARFSVVAMLAIGAYAVLPASLQGRLTNFSAGFSAPGSYAIYLRQQYANDAEQIIRAHPYVGIGVGNYLAGNPYNGTQTQDPHNVLLLQAAEGGYLFAASFVLLIAGCAFALRKMRQVDVTPAAAAVLLATVAHGMVDVYWVRGTPVLSWLLVGMACGGFVKLRRGTAVSEEPV
ncbi:MAG TPA: O-antigen ligase family protein [Gaiellaceae bacterium]|nr:O-antigen ligase family protein [Gaiellaceae bacterium]